MSFIAMRISRMRWYVLVSMVLLILVSPAQRSAAQPYDARFQHYDMADGLSNYTVLSMVQDWQGFMWFGTVDGLSRYDGYTFKVYRNDPVDSTSLAGNRVQALYEDADSTLWVGLFMGGLNRYDRLRDQFTHYDLDEVVGLADSSSLRRVTVQAITGDGRGQVWIGTNYGLMGLNTHTEAFTWIRRNPKDPYSLSSDSVSALLVDRDGLLWVGTVGKGLNVFDPKAENPSFERPPLLPAPQGDYYGGPNDIRAIIEDQSGLLWFGTMSGAVYRSDARRRRFYRVPEAGPEQEGRGVYSLYEDSAGALWIGTQEDGVGRYQPAEKVLTYYRRDPRNPQSISHNKIFSILEDRSGQVWIGTWDGLDKYAPLTSLFVHYTNEPDASNTLSHRRVFSIYEDRKGIIWIGTNGGGLNRFDPNTRVFTHYMGEDNIFPLAEDRGGRLWVGTLGAGIRVFDPEEGAVIHSYTNSPDDAKSLSNDMITALFKSRDEVMWIGTVSHGLNRFDPETNSFTRYEYDPLSPQSLSSNYVATIYEDHTGVLWIGTINGGGLHHFDQARQHLVRFGQNPQEAVRIQGTEVYAIQEDKAGRLWVGTDRGLHRIDPARSQIRVYTERDGLPDVAVQSILIDDDGTMWLGTNNGLTFFDPQTEAFITYTEKEGIQSRTFHGRAYLKSKAGLFYMGGANGFNEFDPSDVNANTHPPPVVLTDFRVHNERYPPDQSPNTLRAVTLEHHQNYFSFTAAALDFANPAQNQYRVKLEGLDEDWINLGTRNTSNYVNVPPRRDPYILRIRGHNNAGVPNAEDLTIAITVELPFWRTWWFYTLVASFVVGVGVGLYGYRIRTLKRLHDLRARIAERLHDDVSGSLTAITYKSEGLLGRSPLDENAQTKLAAINRLARESIRAIREATWVVNPGFDQLDKLVSALEDLAGDMLADNLTYTFKAPEHVPPLRITMDFRQNVFFLYKEILHNIVKHAQATEVTMDVTYHAKMLSVRVTDNGVGFDVDQPSRGHGLHSMQTRADKLKEGLLTKESQSGVGTTVTFQALIS